MSAALSMTETIPSQKEQPGDFAQPAPTLRQLREAAGLPVAALAATLKVPVERLLALEEGRYQELPNLTFARALASSVCRALKVDPATVLQQLPQPGGVKLGSDHPAPAVMNEPRRSLLPLPGWRSPILWAVSLLLLATALWWWLPQADPDAAVQAQAEPQPASQGMLVESVATAAQQPASEPAPSEAVAAQPAPATLPANLVAEQAAAAPALVPAATPPAAATSAVPLAGAPFLQLRAGATTWVQLKDSSGKELLQRTLQPGQVLDYDGKMPVQVVLGRTSGVEVIVRGQPFDTSSFASNRVARFEVK
ncbi:MAG: hypothetical protein RLZZ555_2134 [Pseudomonadota bacterium]|jgi:cytoskeleton protein RodZ